MKTSWIFKLDWDDLIKWWLVAGMTAVFSWVLSITSTWWAITLTTLKTVWIATLTALLSYLLKNLATNSDGDIMTPEQK